jgi:hypothetical protein
VWEVRYLPEAEAERDKLPPAERTALYNAVRKLEAIGPDLGYPHTSDIRQAEGLRELRPRAGRSPWRAIYGIYELERGGLAIVIAAICPESKQDKRGFMRGCDAAAERLAELEE